MATYYMRADGSATKANAIGPASNAAACMSVATQNAATFAEGDIVLLSSQGGDYTSQLLNVTQQTSVTYRKAPGETPRFRMSTKLAAGTEWTSVGVGVYSLSMTVPNAHGCWVGEETLLYRLETTNLEAGSFFPDVVNSVLYVRLSDDSDPGAVDIYLGQNKAGVYIFQHINPVLDGITFRHCGHYEGQKGIYVYKATNPTIQNCDIGHQAGEAAMRIYQCLGTVTIANNEIHHIWNGHPYSGTGDGTPITYNGGGATPPTSVVVHGNYIHDNYVGISLEITECPVEISYNILARQHVNCLSIHGNATNKYTVVHNTIYHKPNPTVIANNGHGCICRNGDSVGATIKSNIFYFDENTVVGAEVIQVDQTDFYYLDIDYNCYYATGTPQITFNFGATTSNTLADFQAWLTDSTAYLGEEANGVQVDPGFVNVSTSNFHPRSLLLKDAGHDGATIGALDFTRHRIGITTASGELPIDTLVDG